MNIKKLREAERVFMSRYPGGFQNEEMQEVGKKHKVDQVSELARATLAKKNFAHQGEVLDGIVKIVTRSSMVSMFEKPKFRDFVNGLNRDDRAYLAGGFKSMFHGSQKKGFNAVLDVLTEGKLAKWSLMTICSLYYRPQKDVFVKPTTTKAVIEQFELDDLVYKPRPSWEFYAAYRDEITAMKSKVHPSLSPNNAAFTGFLMITTGANKKR